MTTITIESNGNTRVIPCDLSVYDIEHAIKSFEIARDNRIRERAERNTSRELTTERQRIAGKLKKAGLTLETDADSWRHSSGIKLEKKSKWSGKPGGSYVLSFRDDNLALKHLVALRGIEGLTFDEGVMEVIRPGEESISFVRRYTVALKGE